MKDDSIDSETDNNEDHDTDNREYASKNAKHNANNVDQNHAAELWPATLDSVSSSYAGAKVEGGSEMKQWRLGDPLTESVTVIKGALWEPDVACVKSLSQIETV